jgi:hypothetical protein
MYISGCPVRNEFITPDRPPQLLLGVIIQLYYRVSLNIKALPLRAKVIIPTDLDPVISIHS